MTGGEHGRGECMVGGMCGREHAWQGVPDHDKYPPLGNHYHPQT